MAMIIIVMGVSGSGKTSVGQMVARRLGCGFADADAFHSAANKAKMAAGTPLTDDDRWPWLDAMRAAIAENIANGETHVYACSALKQIYRDRLRNGDKDVYFVYLSGSFALLEQRLAKRANHFFDPALLKSQVDTLEVPDGAEAITIDITPPLDEIVDKVMAALPKQA
ncbi:gluconokinase [Robbsia andropogonis]